MPWSLKEAPEDLLRPRSSLGGENLLQPHPNVQTNEVEYPIRFLTNEVWHTSVKCWDSNSIGDEGGRQGGIGVNSSGFL